MKLTDVNLQVTGHDKTTFSVADWKARYEAAGMLDYFENHRNASPRNLMFSPETQVAEKVFVLEPPVYTESDIPEVDITIRMSDEIV